VAQYRFYIVGEKDRLRPAEALDCADDVEAVQAASRHLVLGNAAELWDAGRLVGRFSKLGVFTPGG
jgi:hypothetical protein